MARQGVRRRYREQNRLTPDAEYGIRWIEAVIVAFAFLPR
jgi:hypothetical protein